MRIGENITLSLKPATTSGQKKADRNGEFQELLTKYINEVNELQLKAEERSEAGGGDLGKCS